MPITGHIISHTHWDREWFLTSKYTAQWLVPFFDSLFAMLERYPDYCFVLDGQTIMIEDYLEQLSPSEKSASEKKLQKYISQSRLLAGPYYLQPDWRLVSGESLVRNMMLGHQMANSYGGVMKAGWLLDNFGQISQAPQIHREFGIKGIFLWRGIEVHPEKINSEYCWQSPDGSQLIAIYLLTSYRNAMRLSKYAEIAHERIENEIQNLRAFATTPNVLLMNGYDQEIAPDDVLPLIEQINANSNGMLLGQTTPVKYLETILGENPSLKVLRGAQASGKYISVFPGTLSARMYLKQMNRTCENLLTKWAEPMATWLWLLGAEYPKELLDFSWKELLKNHPHDDICGVGIDDVHKDMEDRFEQSKSTSEKIIEQTLLTISNNVDAAHKNNFIIFNPSPWARDDIVTVKARINDNFAVHDAETNKVVAHQMVSKDGQFAEFHFQADSIPGVGYKSFYIGEKKKPVTVVDKVTASEFDCSMENKYLKAHIEKNGSITVADKATGQIFESIAYFEDGADSGDTYNYSYPQKDALITSLDSNAQITLLERGPLQARFKIELFMHLPAALLQNRKERSKKSRKVYIVTYVKLQANSRRLDFITRIRNTVKDHRLRVIFPTNLKACCSFADTPFDVEENPVEFTHCPKDIPDKIRKIMNGARELVPGSSLPLHSFVCLKDDQNGAALLTNGLTEYEIIEKHKIALTLFRSVGWLARTDLLTREGDAGPMIFVPEAQCLRDFEFKYSFLSFRNETTGFLYKQVEQFNTNVAAVYTSEHDGAMDKQKGLFCLDADNDRLVVSAIKKAEREDKLIIRLFNPTDQACQGTLTFGHEILRAERLNLDEHSQRELLTGKYSLTIKVSPKKIITLGLHLKKREIAKNQSMSNTRWLRAFSAEMPDDRNVNIPAFVTQYDLLTEQQRAKHLKDELLLFQAKLKEIKRKLAARKSNQRSTQLLLKEASIREKVASLSRAELEARLSIFLIQKQMKSLKKPSNHKNDEKIDEYDLMLRDIGYKLNTARIDKRVAEYLLKFYKSHNNF